jgi:hypothetical protein
VETIAALLFNYTLGLLLGAIPMYAIVRKAGLSRMLVLLLLVPLAGHVVLLSILAFKEWYPIADALNDRSTR